MASLLPLPNSTTLSVTEAAALGVPALVRAAEHGDDVLVTRRGNPVAYIVGADRVEQLSRLEADLRDALLVLTRAATDTGGRTELDEALTLFGFTREELDGEG